MRDLATLPKAHLHVHLEGAMRPGTLEELAERYGMPVPQTRGFGSFTVFAAMYLAACEVLRTEADLRRLVDEVVSDAATAGAVWVEPSMYAPHHNERLGTTDAVLDIVLDELAASAARHGIAAGLMVAADRTLDPADAVEQATLAVKWSDRGVVSFGLANDETLFPPEPFAEAFTIANNAGLLSTPHAGELAGPDSIRGALDALGADRIQHGVRAVEDPDLLRRLVDEGTCLDVCPTSNLLLAVFPDLSSHSLPTLLEAGVRCSLNGDDPLLFGSGLLEEYELCRHDLGLTDEQLAFLARCSIESSGAPADVKAQGLAGVDAWLQ